MRSSSGWNRFRQFVPVACFERQWLLHGTASGMEPNVGKRGQARSMLPQAIQEKLMYRLKMSGWLPALCAVLGVTTAVCAEENRFARQADAILSVDERPLITPLSHESAPPCDLGCDMPCDFVGGCESCYLFGGDGWSLSDAIFKEDSKYNIGGWVQLGYHNRSTGMFNSRPNKANVHQTWLYAERVADGSEGFDWGFRADLMYGIDADDTQAFGNNPGRWDFANGWDHGAYGWAMPQLYGEVAFGDLSIIGGHFYTLLGYEVVTAPDNFFYSHAFTMYNSEAFTHTGALATYTVSDNIEVYAGWTLGWDTGFDQFNGGNSFLGGVSVGVTDDLTVTYILTAGNLGWIGDGYTHSIVADLAITEKLNYVFQSDLVDTRFAGVGYNTIGINQYLLYWFNDCLGVGGRAEWWKANGDSIYSITGGVNIKPMANFILRPEIRYQWGDAGNVAGIPVDEGAIFGIDAILTF